MYAIKQLRNRRLTGKECNLLTHARLFFSSPYFLKQFALEFLAIPIKHLGVSSIGMTLNLYVPLIHLLQSLFFQSQTILLKYLPFSFALSLHFNFSLSLCILNKEILSLMTHLIFVYFTQNSWARILVLAGKIKTMKKEHYLSQ